ncbi:MAG: glycosyltransferase [Bacteroidia bacterium]
MTYLLIIGLVLLLHYGWLIFAYVHHWNRLEKLDGESNASVAILIPFRNEALHLPVLLDSLEAIDYQGDWNIFMINDHSTDESVAMIQDRKISRLKILHLKNAEGKKEAIKLAWKHCNADVILHTDADCKLPINWLKSMLAPMSNKEVAFVSGPVRYSKRPRPNESGRITFWQLFWHRWYQIDFAALNVAGAAQIQMKKPIMCNGANLAYRSSALGTDLKMDYASGDDVFLMQHIKSKGEGVFFQKDPRAMVRTEAPTNMKAFLNQRLRWAGKNTSYGSLMSTLRMALVWLFNMFILIGLFNVSNVIGLMALFMLIVKILLDTYLLDASRKVYHIGQEAYSQLIIGQIAHVAYMALIPMASKIFKYEWKGRKLK